MQARDIGALGERTAAAYLRRNGYAIVGANVRTRFGEIDIIASNKAYLAFVEVKTRAENARFLPREAVDIRKQARIVKTALLYLTAHPTPLQPRFDVIEVISGTDGDFSRCTIRHLPNAFSAPSGY
ncbi:YraN family protein [Ethanoligenens sp.]|uniref:YraN family protein n=1 Tax=Ethanoligenens sp. TaxID=2099655 RepID=UPI0039E9453F